MIIGLFLIVVGTLWLLYNLGLISTAVTEIIWPLAVIALGFYFLLKKRGVHHFKHWCCGPKDEEKKE